jgi:hypothetical protein
VMGRSWDRVSRSTSSILLDSNGVLLCRHGEKVRMAGAAFGLSSLRPGAATTL